MANAKKVVKVNLQKEIEERIKGTTDKENAGEIAEAVMAVLEIEVSTLKNKLIRTKTDLKKANKVLNSALYPIEMFARDEDYVTKVKAAYKKVSIIEEAIADIEFSHDFFASKVEAFKA